MKVKFKHLVNGYTGIIDNSVIYYMESIGRCVIRKRPRKVNNKQQNFFKTISRHIFRLEMSEDYKNDMNQYVDLVRNDRYRSSDHNMSWSNIYSKIMFNLARIVPDVDLTTLTKEEIYARDLPCISVKRAVEGGLLPRVAGYQELTSLF